MGIMGMGFVSKYNKEFWENVCKYGEKYQNPPAISMAIKFASEKYILRKEKAKADEEAMKTTNWTARWGNMLSAATPQNSDFIDSFLKSMGLK